MGHFTWFSTQ